MCTQTCLEYPSTCYVCLPPPTLPQSHACAQASDRSHVQLSPVGQQHTSCRTHYFFNYILIEWLNMLTVRVP